MFFEGNFVASPSVALPSQMQCSQYTPGEMKVNSMEQIPLPRQNMANSGKLLYQILVHPYGHGGEFRVRFAAASDLSSGALENVPLSMYRRPPMARCVVPIGNCNFIVSQKSAVPARYVGERLSPQSTIIHSLKKVRYSRDWRQSTPLLKERAQSSFGS